MAAFASDRSSKTSAISRARGRSSVPSRNSSSTPGRRAPSSHAARVVLAADGADTASARQISWTRDSSHSSGRSPCRDRPRNAGSSSRISARTTPEQARARPGLQRGHRAQQADQLRPGRQAAPPIGARRPRDGGAQLRPGGMLVPDAARGEPGQQLLPLPRRPERALQRIPRAEDALAVVTGPGIGIGPGMGVVGSVGGSAGVRCGAGVGRRSGSGAGGGRAWRSRVTGEVCAGRPGRARGWLRVVGGAVVV